MAQDKKSELDPNEPGTPLSKADVTAKKKPKPKSPKPKAPKVPTVAAISIPVGKVFTYKDALYKKVNVVGGKIRALGCVQKGNELLIDNNIRLELEPDDQVVI